MQRKIRRCQKGILVLVQDEAIFVADASLGRVYTPHGVRAVYHVSGMHDRTIVHEVPGSDGEQIFRQNDKFNGDTFAEYIKKAFGRALMIVDRAPQHRTGIVSRTLRKITGIRLAFIPTALLELRAIGECWEQSKNDLPSVFCVAMGRLRRTIAEYFASKTFELDILRYLACSL